MHRFKVLLGILLAFVLIGAGCSSPATAPTTGQTGGGKFTITDMNGRTVELEGPREKAFGAGPPATTLIYTFNADKLAGWNNKVSDDLLPWLSEKATKLPVLGRASGSQGTFNPEVLIQNGVDVIFDAGDLGENYRKMADDLQKQTGIPVIQLSTDLSKLHEAYELMGKVFGDPERAEQLGTYVKRVNEEVARSSAAIPDEKKVTVYYGQGDKGLSTAGAGSIHSRIIDNIGAKNVAGQAPKPSGRTDVNAEQLLSWNPHWVVLVPGSGASPLATNPASDPTFGRLAATKAGRILISPLGPYGWFDTPPAANQVLGTIWAAEAIYPDHYNFEVPKEVKEFYKLFYHFDLTDAQVSDLLTKSGFKA